MNVVQDWAGYLFRSGYFTPSILQPLNTIHTIFQNYIVPSIGRVIEKPDLASIALMLLILFLSLKLLNMLWQAVVFWIRLAFRIVFWGGAVVLALWIANRGVDGVTEDVGHWTRVWRGEYDYWKDQAQTQAQMAMPTQRGGKAKSQWGF